jgi:hypothetical protein
MPLYPNTEQGTVSQYSSQWSTKILEAPTGFIKSNVFGAQSAPIYGTESDLVPLRIPLAAYQRVIARYYMFYESTNDNEIQFRLSNEGSGSLYGTAYNTDINFALMGILDTQTGQNATASVEAAVATGGSTNGASDIIKLDAGSDDSPLFAILHATCVSKTSVNNFIRLSPRIITGTADGTRILTGSYVEYKYY